MAHPVFPSISVYLLITWRPLWLRDQGFIDEHIYELVPRYENTSYRNWLELVLNVHHRVYSTWVSSRHRLGFDEVKTDHCFALHYFLRCRYNKQQLRRSCMFHSQAVVLAVEWAILVHIYCSSLGNRTLWVRCNNVALHPTRTRSGRRRPAALHGSK